MKDRTSENGHSHRLFLAKSPPASNMTLIPTLLLQQIATDLHQIRLYCRGSHFPTGTWAANDQRITLVEG
ncbi:hypothetical protein TUM17377_35830 [Shewanella chilikensis]|nr:hypothetical protein TUM17377_35830 [Shewanella chilikensis]